MTGDKTDVLHVDKSCQSKEADCVNSGSARVGGAQYLCPKEVSADRPSPQFQLANTNQMAGLIPSIKNQQPIRQRDPARSRLTDVEIETSG